MSNRRFKKGTFSGKSVFIFLLSYFCTLFSKNCLLATRPPFLNRRLLRNGSFFQHSYISYGKRQKSCTLVIVIWVKCLYLTSPIFNSSAKSNRLFYCKRGSILLFKNFLFQIYVFFFQCQKYAFSDFLLLFLIFFDYRFYLNHF